METVVGWLRKEVSLKQLFVALPFIVLLLFGISHVGVWLDTLLFASAPPTIWSEIPETVPWPYIFLAYFLVVGLLFPLGEELVFRILPFWVVFRLARKLDARRKWYLVLATYFLAEIGFGFYHGGYIGVLVQGVMGLVLGCVYLKWSTYGANHRKGFIASSIVHCSYNSAVGVISLIIFLLT